MNKNEYRRAFIMLRAAIPGYGGHARLERRTLTGSLYFIVTAPQGAGTLTALLAGESRGEYYVAPIGALAPDRRGQLTLAWQFDPRNIDGRPLEAYAWVVIARNEDAAVALTGNVDGHRALDMAALSRAVMAALSTPEEPAADLPEPTEEIMPRPEPQPESQPEPQPEPQPQTLPEAPVEEAPTQGDVKVYTRMRSRRRPARARETAQPVETAPAETAPEPVPKPAEARTAAATLGLDITTPWPGDAEPLRRLFATQKPVDTPLGGGYTYITTPMPIPGGNADALIGLKAEGGAIVGIRYAVPGAYAPEPPVGLDNYVWTPTENGGGYWVLDITTS